MTNVRRFFLHHEKDIHIRTSRKEHPFPELYHFDLHLRTKISAKIYELSKRRYFLILEGGEGDTFRANSNAESRGDGGKVEKYELRGHRWCILTITSREDGLRRGEEKLVGKREIRGKGKDGGTNKVYSGGGATRGGK